MKVYIFILLLVVFSSCVRNKSGQVVENAAPVNEKKFEVVEVVQANAYSYLKVKENFADRWVAVTKQDIKPGDVFYYDNALQMTDFKSKDLDRTFDVVYFINKISRTPFSEKKMDLGAMHHGKPKLGNAEVEIKKGADELSLKQLFADRDKYASTSFEIKGVVVKVTPQVMGKNWVHIQDGTGDQGSFDLTVTTQALPKVGQTVTFKGKLTLNKDFGAGYSYEVIMEDAELTDTMAASAQL